MIYSVIEWCGTCNQRYFFDSEKVNFAVPFEVNYLQYLIKAAQHFDKILNVSHLKGIEERTSNYQDGMACWENLLAHPRCRVDFEVQLILSE